MNEQIDNVNGEPIEPIEPSVISEMDNDELMEMQRTVREMLGKNSDDMDENKYRRYLMKRTKKGAVHGGKHTNKSKQLKRLFKGVCSKPSKNVYD